MWGYELGGLDAADPRCSVVRDHHHLAVGMIFPWPFGKPTPAHPHNIGGTQLPRRKQSKPVTGFRTWRVKYEGDAAALWSLMQSHVWDGPDVTAECLPRREHEAPDLNCACGFYCQLPDHPIDEWEAHTSGRVRATGTVDLYGRIIVCERGYKAGRAVIQSPVVVDLNCRGIGCLNPVEAVQVPYNTQDFWCHCGIHPPDRPDAQLVDAVPWMHQTLEDLHIRYPGVDFLTWMEI